METYTDYIDRMEIELSELTERKNKLKNFLSKVDEEEVTISGRELELLTKQFEAMKIYEYFLSERLKFAKERIMGA